MFQIRTALIVMSAIVCISDDANAVADRYQNICVDSGYEIGSPENRVCTTLIKLHPPIDSPGYFHAVHRSITQNTGGRRVYCSLQGGMDDPVSCESEPLRQVKQKRKQE